MRKWPKVADILLIVGIVFYILCIIGPYRPMIVMTKSMEPVLKKGDIIIGRKVSDEMKLKVGDICSYRPEDAGYTVTHRIIEISDDGYIFKGDNNVEEDADPIGRDRIEYIIMRK